MKVRGGLGSILVLCEENSHSYDVKSWVVLQVDGEKVKADTWYQLIDGEVKEVLGE